MADLESKPKAVTATKYKPTAEAISSPRRAQLPGGKWVTIGTQPIELPPLKGSKVPRIIPVATSDELGILYADGNGISALIEQEL